MASKPFYAVIAGVGPGTGRSVAIRFAKAYSVAVLARKPESYNDVVNEINKSGGHAVGISADVSDPQSVTSAFDAIKKQFQGKKLAAAVFNSGGGLARKPFLELTPDDLDAALKNQAGGLFHFGQATIPLLLESVQDSPRPPTLIITGATASVRGSPLFSTFAASKFAVRALGQSLAREFHPRGVHVAHAIIDGVIDIPRTASYTVNDGKPDGKISPDAIAESYWALHEQHRSAFTQEIDIRPYVEKF